jgi:hypothetical protein
VTLAHTETISSLTPTPLTKLCLKFVITCFKIHLLSAKNRQASRTLYIYDTIYTILVGKFCSTCSMNGLLKRLSTHLSFSIILSIVCLQGSLEKFDLWITWTMLKLYIMVRYTKSRNKEETPSTHLHLGRLPNNKCWAKRASFL